MNSHLQIIGCLDQLDIYNRITAWSDATGQHYVRFHNGLSTTAPIPVNTTGVKGLVTTLTNYGWQVVSATPNDWEAVPVGRRPFRHRADVRQRFRIRPLF